jgi:hypothetical protein
MVRAKGRFISLTSFVTCAYLGFPLSMGTNQKLKFQYVMYLFNKTSCSPHSAILRWLVSAYVQAIIRPTHYLEYIKNIIVLNVLCMKVYWKKSRISIDWSKRIMYDFKIQVLGLIMTKASYRFLLRASDRTFHFNLDRHAHACISISYLTHSVRWRNIYKRNLWQLQITTALMIISECFSYAPLTRGRHINASQWSMQRMSCNFDMASPVCYDVMWTCSVVKAVIDSRGLLGANFDFRLSVGAETNFEVFNKNNLWSLQ